MNYFKIGMFCLIWQSASYAASQQTSHITAWNQIKQQTKTSAKYGAFAGAILGYVSSPKECFLNDTGKPDCSLNFAYIITCSTIGATIGGTIGITQKSIQLLKKKYLERNS